MKYLIIIEQTDTGYSAYSPDLAGCVSTAPTEGEVLSSMRTAIEMHIDGLKMDGLPIPRPMARSSYVEIAA